MVGGAVLNDAAFIGGNYLARAFGGSDKPAEKEIEHHDRPLEAYQTTYAKYSLDGTKLLDWIATKAKRKAEAKQNFTNMDYAFKLYNQAHPEECMVPPKEPKFSNFYQASEQQKKRRSCSWVLGRLLLAPPPSISFELSLPYDNGHPTRKSVLQPRRLLERLRCD